MTLVPGSRIPALVFALIAGTSASAQAQTCRGMPRAGGVAFALGQVYLGSTYGFAASKGILALGFNSLNSDTDVSGWDANFRLTVPMGSSIQICPSLGIDYTNLTSPIPDGRELTTRDATGAAGIGISIDREVRAGISVAPFVAVDYHFNAMVFSLDNEDEEDDLSGDTLSYLNIQYGGVVRFKTFYAGLTVDRSAGDEKGLYRSRLFLGLAFGGGGSAARKSPVPQRAMKSPDRR